MHRREGKREKSNIDQRKIESEKIDVAFCYPLWQIPAIFPGYFLLSDFLGSFEVSLWFQRQFLRTSPDCAADEKKNLSNPVAQRHKRSKILIL
jgi:hypothetical protein